MSNLTRQLLKPLGIRLCSALGMFPAGKTPKKDIQSLLDAIKPLKTSKQLIRFGPQSDGGYLIPDDLDGIDACFSPGVSEIAGFENDCAEKGIEVFMADESVDLPPSDHKLFNFSKINIGSYKTAKTIPMEEWVAKSIPSKDGDLILQMDIEGCEYETILNMPSSLMKRFRIMVIEFHLLNHLWNRHFFMFANPAFKKILDTHYCVHIHPNNSRKPLKIEGIPIPPLMEFTFLRKDRTITTEPTFEFPHPLDYDCSNKAHLALPPVWYGSSKG